MAIANKFYFLVCLCFTLSESFSVDSLPKCGVKDKVCLKNLYQYVVQEVGKTGVPAQNIPVADPMVLKDITVPVLDFVNLTLVDGVAKGIKNCIIDHLDIDFEKGTGTQETMCDLVIKGHYTVFGDSELLKRLVGGNSLHGDGKGKVKLEKLVLKTKFTFYPVKHDDGEIYVNCLYKDVVYDYDIKGKATFELDNIMVGKENISELVVRYLNQNWKYVLKTFGRAFVDKAMEFYLDFTEKFFDGIPAKHFITDDLTPYLRN